MPKTEREEQSLFTAAPLPQTALDDAPRLACMSLIRSKNVGPVTPEDIIEAGVPLSGLSPDVATAEQYPLGQWQPLPPAPPPCSKLGPAPSRYRRPNACHRSRHTHSQ